MGNTRAGKVVYVPHPNPHPQAEGAPSTGVPVNPVPPKVQPVRTVKDVTP